MAISCRMKERNLSKCPHANSLCEEHVWESRNSVGEVLSKPICITYEMEVFYDPTGSSVRPRFTKNQAKK